MNAWYKANTFHPVLNCAETRIGICLALSKWVCKPVEDVWSACSALRPTNDGNHGRLMIATRRASGLTGCTMNVTIELL